MDSTTILVLIGVWILCGLAAGWISKERGNSATDGVFIGLLMGPLGLLMALTGTKTEPVSWEQPTSTPEQQPSSLPPAPAWGTPAPPAASTFCPRCGTARAGSFRYCRACGLDFDAS